MMARDRPADFAEDGIFGIGCGMDVGIFHAAKMGSAPHPRNQQGAQTESERINHTAPAICVRLLWSASPASQHAPESL